MPLWACLPLNSGHWDKFSHFSQWVDLPEWYKPKRRDERERERGLCESLKHQTLIRAWNDSLKCDWQFDILELPWWQRTRQRQILLSNHLRGCLIKVTDFCKILKEGCDSFQNLASVFESRRWHEQEKNLWHGTCCLILWSWTNSQTSNIPVGILANKKNRAVCRAGVVQTAFAYFDVIPKTCICRENVCVTLPRVMPWALGSVLGLIKWWSESFNT